LFYKVEAKNKENRLKIEVLQFSGEKNTFILQLEGVEIKSQTVLSLLNAIVSLSVVALIFKVSFSFTEGR
jgi:hypothetical protein